MVNGGWVKLYRELKSKSIWQLSSPQQKVVLITILLLANHEENKWEWKGEQFVCKPGQLITSLNSLVNECGEGVTIRNVRTALERFEKLGFLTNTSTKTGRLITVVNWEKYQGRDYVSDKGADKDLTKSRQRPDKDLTTNKNDKEYKNDKEIYNKRFEPPSVNDVIDYCKERNNKIDAQAFIDFYTSKDWMIGKNKMKDWKAAVRSWERNQAKKEETAKPGNTFNNFESRSYDFTDLERQLLDC